MLEKVLFANRGDQLRSGAATKSYRTAAATARVGDLAAETFHV
jgi:hypothetical protein